MRKFIRRYLALILLPLCLVSCSKNTPKEVAITWLNGFNRMEFDQAMKVSTNDTKNLLSSLKELTDAVSDSGKTELKKITVSVKDVKEDGNKATVTYVSSDNPREQTLNLVREQDKWLVLFTKTDLVGVMPEKEDPEAAEVPAATDSTATPADTTAAH